MLNYTSFRQVTFGKINGYLFSNKISNKIEGPFSLISGIFSFNSFLDNSIFKND